jgi:hypothetical protein
MFSKLDEHIQREWEKSLEGDSVSRLKQLIELLTKQCRLMESMAINPKSKASVKTTHITVNTSKCGKINTNLTHVLVFYLSRSKIVLTHFSPLYSFEYGLYNSSWKIVGFEFIEMFLVTVYSDFLETAIMNVLSLPCFLCIQCNFKFSLQNWLILCARSN